MSARTYVWTMTGNSPAAASTALLTTTPQVPAATDAERLTGWDYYRVEFDALGGTGGTTDLTLDTSHDNGSTWSEWIRTPAAGAGTAVKYIVHPTQNNTIVVYGRPATGATAPVLAVNTCVGGLPGALVRCRATAGAGTSVGAAQTVRIIGFRLRK